MQGIGGFSGQLSGPFPHSDGVHADDVEIPVFNNHIDVISTRFGEEVNYLNVDLNYHTFCPHAMH